MAHVTVVPALHLLADLMPPEGLVCHFSYQIVKNVRCLFLVLFRGYSLYKHHSLLPIPDVEEIAANDSPFCGQIS